MIDFVKIQLINYNSDWFKKIEEKPLIEFKTTVSTKTGELSNKKEAEFRGMKLIIYESGFTLLQGSLHKYWNHGQHNYNDFTFHDLQNVINDLKKTLDLDLNKCVLRNLEVGVNITPPINTNSILNNLIIHQGKKFKDVSLGLSNVNYKQAEHERYYLKVYNKKIQYDNQFEILNELMRIELKIVKMIDINKLGITSLLDLTNKKKILSLKPNLLKAWDDIVLFDETLNKNRLTNFQKETKINQWQNSNYWLGLGKQYRYEQKRIYYILVKNYSQQIQKQVRRLIEIKFGFLIHNNITY